MGGRRRTGDQARGAAHILPLATAGGSMLAKAMAAIWARPTGDSAAALRVALELPSAMINAFSTDDLRATRLWEDVWQGRMMASTQQSRSLQPSPAIGGQRFRSPGSARHLRLQRMHTHVSDSAP